MAPSAEGERGLTPTGVDRGEQRFPPVVDRMDDREDAEVSRADAADQADRRKAAGTPEIDDDHADFPLAARGSARLAPRASLTGTKSVIFQVGVCLGVWRRLDGWGNQYRRGVRALSPVG